LKMKETLWKNKLNFLKDVPMIYTNFITILIVVSEETWEAYFRPDLNNNSNNNNNNNNNNSIRVY
jgi:hypothetical protein